VSLIQTNTNKKTIQCAKQSILHWISFTCGGNSRISLDSASWLAWTLCAEYCIVFVCVWFESMTLTNNIVQIWRIELSAISFVEWNNSLHHAVRFEKVKNKCFSCEKGAFSSWDRVATLCWSRVISTYVIMGAILNYNFQWVMAMLGVAPLNCPTSKTRYDLISSSTS